MNNKYSVACITLVRDKYTIRMHGAPCSSLDGVTACVVYTADSIRKFDSKSNRTAYSIRDSIRTQKKTIRRSLQEKVADLVAEFSLLSSAKYDQRVTHRTRIT